MNKGNIKKVISKIRDNSFRYLFLLACLTCATIGWTSARYTSDIYASPDSARTAQFSYEIDSTVYKLNRAGEVLHTYDLKPQSWQSTSRVFQYIVDTGNGVEEEVAEKIRIDFEITLETEVAIRLAMEKEVPEDRPMTIEKVELKGPGISETLTGDPNDETMLFYDVYLSEQPQTYTFSVTLINSGLAEYNPATGENGETIGYQADQYMNLVPRFTQID